MIEYRSVYSNWRLSFITNLKYVWNYVINATHIRNDINLCIFNIGWFWKSSVLVFGCKTEAEDEADEGACITRLARRDDQICPHIQIYTKLRLVLRMLSRKKGRKKAFSGMVNLFSRTAIVESSKRISITRFIYYRFLFLCRCDRIIWCGKGLKQHLYTRGESRLSDHRPVKAIFTVEVGVSQTLRGLRSLFLSERFDQLATRFEVSSKDNGLLCKGRSSFQIWGHHRCNYSNILKNVWW